MASKIIIRHFFLIFIIVLFSGFCGCKEEDTSESYYVRFNLNGTDYEFTSGILKDLNGNTYTGVACGFKTNDEQSVTGISIFASPSPADLNNFDLLDIHCLLVTFEESGSYSGSDATSIRINENLIWEDTDTTFSVTEIGNFGGVISGTFSGVDTINGSTVTDGEFYVIRLPDNIFTY